MSLFKLELQSKTVAQKFALGTTHLTAMTGNAHFPAATRVPTDAQVTAAQTALQTASDAADAAEVVWKQKNAERNAAEGAWDTTITARARNCEAVTPGNVAALTSTGLPMRPGPQPTGPLGAPQNLRASMGDLAGEIDTMWDALKGSASNVVSYKEQGSTGPWIQAGITKKSRFTVTGLTSGRTYVFRVNGVGTDGPGPFSDEAVKMAP